MYVIMMQGICVWTYDLDIIWLQICSLRNITTNISVAWDRHNMKYHVHVILRFCELQPGTDQIISNPFLWSCRIQWAYSQWSWIIRNYTLVNFDTIEPYGWWYYPLFSSRKISKGQLFNWVRFIISV